MIFNYIHIEKNKICSTEITLLYDELDNDSDIVFQPIELVRHPTYQINVADDDIDTFDMFEHNYRVGMAKQGCIVCWISIPLLFYWFYHMLAVAHMQD